MISSSRQRRREKRKRNSKYKVQVSSRASQQLSCQTGQGCKAKAPNSTRGRWAEFEISVAVCGCFHLLSPHLKFYQTSKKKKLINNNNSNKAYYFLNTHNFYSQPVSTTLCSLISHGDLHVLVLNENFMSERILKM